LASAPRAGRPAARPGTAVRARAWCRVDLAGGTLDIWPLGLLHPGSRTINVAIDLHTTVQLVPRERTYRVRQGDSLVEARSAEELIGQPGAELVGTVLSELDCPPVEVRLASGSPRGGGLGASSAMTVALIAAAEELRGKGRSPARQVAELARDLEARLMGLPTGLQDHYPALLGGVLEIAHGPGGQRVRRLAVDLAGLGDSLLVVYTGQSHFSAGQNWQVIRRRLEGEETTTELLGGIAEVARQMPEALEGGDLGRVGELMLREWGFRRHLAEGVSTPVVEALIQAALAKGAWGAKVCGAGGGGSIAVLCPPERRTAIAETLAAAGGTLLDTRPIGARLRVSRGPGERGSEQSSGR
jgi:D-glycero-alpha-D-manno-heptose-7-phosphate kinase